MESDYDQEEEDGYHKYGAPFRYDPEFRGPVAKRNCTDVFFLLVFFVFIGGWGVVSYYAVKFGDPERILYPSDSYGRICGRDELKDRPYLFFFNLLKCAKVDSFKKGCNTPQVCVSKCPSYTVSYVQYYKDPSEFNSLPYSEKQKVKERLICMDHINIAAADLNEIPKLLVNKSCALIYFKSDVFAGRCIPSALKRLSKSNSSSKDSLKNILLGNDMDHLLYDEDNKTINMSKMKSASELVPAFTMRARAFAEEMFHDIMLTWRYILVFFVIAMVVSFLWIMLLQLIAGLMIWLSIVALVVLLLLATFGCFARYQYLGTLTPDDYDEDLNTDVHSVDFFSLLKVQLNAVAKNRNMWLVITIVVAVVSVILFLTLIFLRKRITIAIALIKEASKAISSAKSALFFPIFPYIAQIVVIAFWGFNAILIVATAKGTYREVTPNFTDTGRTCNPLVFNNITGNQCAYRQHFEDNIITLAQVFNLFMGLWLLFFISGFCQVALAGAFSAYYWAFNKPDDVPSFPVFTGAYRALRYHAGSIALGSFLLATLRLIRIIIEYIDSKCKQYRDNAIAKSVICLCRCCFWCLETFLKFLNTNAYIMMSVYGDNFCTSARKAFMLLMRNILRVLVIDKVADYLLFLGKLVVTALLGVVSYIYFTNKFEIKFAEPPLLNYQWVPVFAICLGTYLIANSFFAVYDMSVDTIFLCFLEDCERNDGSPSKPYYMSKELMEILQYKNKMNSSTREAL